MQIGNWKITEQTIEWTGGNGTPFVIEKQALLDIEYPRDAPGTALYKWIMRATDTEWVAADDLYDLNFAFIFAAGYWRQNLDYSVFDNTAAYQFALLDEEEGEAS